MSSGTKFYRIYQLEMHLAKLDTDVVTLSATVTALQAIVATTITVLKGIQVTQAADAVDDAAVVAANTALNTLITNLQAVLPH